MKDLRYPTGPMPRQKVLDDRARTTAIAAIAATPAALRAAVNGLTDQQLDTPYRPGGWTVRQVVHHVPDSHMNAYVRTKLALTESDPTVKTYEEARWAELPEARGAPVEISLRLLEAIHGRWVAALEQMAPSDFSRCYRHPDLGLVTLDELVAMYAWHGPHHVAHITELRTREGWS